MNYKRMWLALKKIVNEECDIFGGEPEHTLPEESKYFKGQAEEAEYILDEMKILEGREKLLEGKERGQQ